MKPRFLTSHYAWIQGCYWMAYCILLSFSSVYLLDQGFSNTQIGLLLGLSGLLTALLQPFVGARADHLKVLSLGQFAALLILAMLLCTGGLLLLPGQAVQGGLFLSLLLLLQLLTSLLYALGMDCVNQGMPLNFGGPYLGFMATGSALMRKLPGRIVGQTTDVDGKRAFVLTLQAREQHIRREKAGSNICSNQALCALTAACYLGAVGPEGLREVARQCYDKAHYFAEKLASIGLPRREKGPFFHEFATECPGGPEKMLVALEERDILGGQPMGDGRVLWCVTEKAERKRLDEAVAVIREVTNL